MLGTPSVNDIESAYGSQQGLQSLSQKVAQEPKGPAGLPSDLKDLIALDDLQQQMQSAQTQQNLQNPTNMPTVADQLKQKIMAMEQARQQQAIMARAAPAPAPAAKKAAPAPAPSPASSGLDVLGLLGLLGSMSGNQAPAPPELVNIGKQFDLSKMFNTNPLSPNTGASNTMATGGSVNDLLRILNSKG